MASSCEKLDQLVKDYLLFRGFSATFKALEQELKTDKDRGLRVDKMMEQIWTLIASYDLPGLREYWRYLNQRIFSRLDQRYAQSVQKLESSLLKLYLVNAHQCGKQDKVRSFFEQMGQELQSNSDFKEWFAFPFVSNPSENSMFSVHFTKQWQDTLQLSLHNFLSVVLQAMLPTLLNVEFDARRMKALQEENVILKQQLINNTTSSEPIKDDRPPNKRSFQSELHPPTSPPDMVYDFSGLADEPEPSKETKRKQSTRRFPLSLTSPLSGRKKSDSSQPKQKSSTSNSITTSSSSSSSSAAAASNFTGRRPTEMSVFPPPSGTKLTMGSKKLTASTSSSSSQPQPQTPSLISSTSNVSPLPGRKQTSSNVIISSSTSSSSSSVSTSQANNDTVHQMAARSISAPGGKKSPSLKRMGLSMDSSTQRMPLANQFPVNESEGDRMSTARAGSGNTVLDAPDPDSPFLLLEMDEYMEHGSSVSYCQFSPNGQYVASLDLDGVVKVWMWSPQPTTQATIMSRSAFLSLTWHYKWDRWLLLGNKSGTIRLFDVKESKTNREVEIHPDNPTNCMRVTDISTSPTGNSFVCATASHCPFTNNPSTVLGKLFQWDLKTLKLEKSLQVDSDVCNAITCSCYTSGGQLITGGADGCIRIYDDSKSKASLKWAAHNSPIHTIQVRGKGDVYSMDSDGKISEWDLSQPGQALNTFYIGPRQTAKTSGGSCRGRLLALDVTGHYLLTYKGVKGAIYKLEGQSGPSPVMELKSHQAPVMTVDWSPSQDTFSSFPSQDTKHCLTGSADGRIKISTLLSK